MKGTSEAAIRTFDLGVGSVFGQIEKSKRLGEFAACHPYDENAERIQKQKQLENAGRG